MNFKKINFALRVVHVVSIVMLMAMITNAYAASTNQRTFATPQAAVNALEMAIHSNNLSALSAVLGENSHRLINSGDAVADQHARERFTHAYAQSNKILIEKNNTATLLIGEDDWPFPIPLIKSANRWRFDTATGEQEILSRRIGRNELAAIQVMLAIVDAEREYIAQDRDTDGILEYAAKFASSPGKYDGLYWEQTRADEPVSPLGPLVAAAANEGYAVSASTPLAPYHGYFYRIMTAQGPHAVGGEYEYMVKGQLIGGFAVVAYPARYGVSGVKTFIVNHDGVVFEKDLGNKTEGEASRMMKFDPDESWKRL